MEFKNTAMRTVTVELRDSNALRLLKDLELANIIRVLPFEEPTAPPVLKNSERFSGAISKETAEKLHKHLREVRKEWERNIY